MALFMFGSILPSGSGLFTAFAKLAVNEKDPTVPHSISVECVNPEGGTAELSTFTAYSGDKVYIYIA